jgi:chemotaxis protein CheX
MDVKYINPFLLVTIDILDKLTNIKLHKGPIYAKSNNIPMNNIAIVVGVTGGLCGQMVLGMDMQAARSIAGKMLGKVIGTLDDMSKSAISELANIIMGNVATMFSKQKITMNITPPTVLIGENIQWYSSKSTIITIPFSLSIGGKLEVDLVMDSVQFSS